MEKTKRKFPQDYILASAAFLTLAFVFIGTIFNLPDETKALPVIVIYVAMAVVLALQDYFQKRRLGWLFLLLLTILASSLYFFGIEPGFYLIIFFIISANAMIYFREWGGLAWVTTLAVISMLSFVGRYGFQSGLVNVLVYSGGYLFFGAFGRALARAQEAREQSERLYIELQAAHEQLQDYVFRVEELAVAQERNRLAREVHDSLGHRMTVSAVQLEGAQRLIAKDPEKAAEMVGTVRKQVKQALAELRQTVATLREPVETGMAIEHSLQRLVNSFEDATGLTVNVTVEEIPPLPDTHRGVLFRIAQEALTNVQRHAKADKVWLTLFRHDDSIRLLVSDNGIGFPNKAEEISFGLRGIRERAVQLGGTCTFEERVGGGAQVSVNMPLPEGGDQDE
jgi:signal transduction histidine kinase